MYKIKFNDGSVLEGLELNGNNFISSRAITSEFFRGKLNNVIIEGDNDDDDMFGLCGTHEHMELVLCREIDGKTWFVLRDLTPEELEMIDIKGDIAYLSMMSGIDLE